MRDSICNDCAKRTRCDMAEIGRSPLAISTCYGYEKGNPSNADRIRSMTDEELAEWIAHPKISYCQYDICDGETDCAECALEWLKQEIEEGE